MAEKIVKAKQPETEKPKAVQVKAKPAADKDKPKQPNVVVRWYRETIGELRKVAWPSMPDARRLTAIVLLVMLGMSLVLGLLDWVFSWLIGRLLLIG